MMGHQVEQAALFYEFSLETHVPTDHRLRSIDRFVELGEVRRELTAFYSTLGRPSIDPELMIRMLIVGYCFGIRSERRLCEEVHLNLAYRWFCRLGLDGDVPDHSTFSKNRHGRFRESDLLRRVFETSCSAASQRVWSAAKPLRSMPVCSRRMPIGRKGLRVRRGCHQKRPAGRSKNIWLCSTMGPSALRPMSCPSSSHRPIRQRDGPEPMADKHSSPIPPTI